MARNLQEMPKNIWTFCFSTFAMSNTQPLWILIQYWKQGQESHYIQPCNLSSALCHKMDPIYNIWNSMHFFCTFQGGKIVAILTPDFPWKISFSGILFNCKLENGCKQIIWQLILFSVDSRRNRGYSVDSIKRTVHLAFHGLIYGIFNRDFLK